MENAIRKAIEGGYNVKKFYPKNVIPNHDEITIASTVLKETILLDSLFWQCLGKAEGWGGDISDEMFRGWKYQWHKFIDHLAAGKDINSFFETLLKLKNK